MLLRSAILGPILVGATSLTALAQNATYNPPPSDVGRLQTPGVVGRSDPILSLGRVGGSTTGRFDPYGNTPQVNRTPNAMPNRTFSPRARPRGILDPTAGIPGYEGGSNRIPSVMDFRPRVINPRTSFENNKLQSFSTHHQLARSSIASEDVRDTGVLADWRAILASRNRSMTPIELFHSRANLLSPKSPLGQIVTTSEIAIYDATPVTPIHTTIPAADSTLITPEEEGAPLRAFDNAMADRLRRQYEQYKADGLAFFKERNFVRARDCFDICRSLDRKSAWPCAMDTLVAVETQEYYRAVNSLMGALSRAQSLDDIELVNIKQLYASDLDFEKGLNNVSNLSSMDAQGSFQAGHLLLSYFAWHNHDLPTAVSAAQATVKSVTPEEEKYVQRYADQLKERAARPVDLQK